MSFKKFLVIPLIVAILAAILQVGDQLFSSSCHPEGNVGFGWISFQAWAVYFLAGCTVKGGIDAFIGYALGVIASILIMTFGGSLSCLGFWAMPVAIFVLVIPIICLERAKVLVPALFIGAGAFFAFMSYVPGASFTGAAITELIYCVIGLVLGYVTITLRGLYEAKVAKDEKVK